MYALRLSAMLVALFALLAASDAAYSQKKDMWLDIKGLEVGKVGKLGRVGSGDKIYTAVLLVVTDVLKDGIVLEPNSNSERGIPAIVVEMDTKGIADGKKYYSTSFGTVEVTGTRKVGSRTLHVVKKKE